ncbi:hypothetical protein LSCM1_04492 [Leishmania martiniquensis]|uniref:Uncharacterized protein n=1 Tax=Leishmania martiniquensis TaxID=1580590 RepID=A0A836KPY2_9TRYP|nr:hypothetical protein LSCM1_04492 [Leishmania martiniquensis]
MQSNPLAGEEAVMASPTSAEAGALQQPSSSQQASTVGASTLSPTAASADSHVAYALATAATTEQAPQRHEDMDEAAIGSKARAHNSGATAKASTTRPSDGEPVVQGTRNEEAVEEGDDDDDDGNNGDDDDGAYASEYRSLLFRVAEMEAQEQQQARQSSFALRMAQRETKLMGEVAAQQQAYVASQAFSASSLQASGSPKASNADAESEMQTATSVACRWPSAEEVRAAVMTDARIAWLAHRMEHAQLQCRRFTDAAELLRSHARWTHARVELQERLKAETEQLLCRLHEDAGLWHSVMPSSVGELQERHNCARSSTASPTAPLPPEGAWQSHTSGLTTLGGTLAKVHTLFRDPECRASMSIVATTLTEVGRQCQSLLQALQALTETELQIEADLRQRRPLTLEWGLYAAHAQQAREVGDVFSPVTLAEMRAIGVRKSALRRQQELRTALTLLLLRDAERAVSSSGSAAAASPSSAPVQQSMCLSSPPPEVTPETMKALADTCTRREGLRDRLWRELLYLKKCARRDLGTEWVSQVEAAALASLAVTADTGGGSRALETVLEDDLRRASYDGLASLVALAASTPRPQCDGDDGAKSCARDGSHDADEESNLRDESDGLPPSPRPSSAAPAAQLIPRVQVLSLIEAVQTRANSIVSLLAENAKHWQRTLDVVAEAELCSSSTDAAWCRTAELLLRRCMDADAVELLRSDTHDDDASSHTTCTSSLLLQEQQLLNSLHASQATIIEAVNAALAQVYHEFTVPLERAKQETAILIRLLQLSDEAGAPENHHGDTRGADVLLTHTTPALERAMHLLNCAEEDGRKSDGAAPSVAMGGAGPDRSLSQVRLPQLPLRVEAVQSTISALSAKWKDDLAAETAAIRTTFAETQATLERYAQYSMAEVPSLLEKALAEAKALQERAAESAARSSRAAALAAEVQQQRTLLAKSATKERNALVAAVQETRLDVAALQAQVAQLQAQRDLSATESLRRCEIRKTEAAAWQSFLLDDPRQHQAVEDDGESAGDGEIEEEGGSVDVAPVVSNSLLEVSTGVKCEAEGEDEDGDVVDGSPEPETTSAKHELAEELDIMREEEARASGESDKRDGDGCAVSEEERCDKGADDEAATLQLGDEMGGEHTAADEDEEAEGEYHADEEVPDEAQGGAQVKSNVSHTEDRVDEAPTGTTPAGSEERVEAVSRARGRGKRGRRRLHPENGARREVQRRHEQPQQRPSILGEPILGLAEPGQQPPVFDSAVASSFAYHPPPQAFAAASTNRPVLEDNPFYSGFGFEE